MKRALVLSYSNISKDSRVLRQVDWLASDNYIVDAAGLGSSPKGVETYISITPPSLGIRLLTYIFLSSKRRGLIILQKFYKSEIFKWITEGKYETVILNDLDFLGVDEIFKSASKSKTPVYLDLHEYFPDPGGSLLFRALHTRYYRYLQYKITDRLLAGFLTVSSDIARLYSENLGLKMIPIENVPIPSDLPRPILDTGSNSSGVIPKTAEILYHGNAGRGRGLYHLVLAMKKVRPGIVLNLVLTGSKFHKELLVLFSKILRVQRSVKFWPSVLPAEVTDFISKFDLEVIFYPPPHSRNVLFSFPNKFFEALSAGLGIIVGPSPSMSKVVDRHQCGMTLQGWGISDLRDALNREITRDQLNQWKANTNNALDEFNFESNRRKFLSLVTGTPEKTELAR
jgi:glycosyltransferase involved in cell wall biosynthesis